VALANLGRTIQGRQRALERESSGPGTQRIDRLGSGKVRPETRQPISYRKVGIISSIMLRVRSKRAPSPQSLPFNPGSIPKIADPFNSSVERVETTLPHGQSVWRFPRCSRTCYEHMEGPRNGCGVFGRFTVVRCRHRKRPECRERAPSPQSLPFNPGSIPKIADPFNSSVERVETTLPHGQSVWRFPRCSRTCYEHMEGPRNGCGGVWAVYGCSLPA